ncbi:Oidioi.mRNA.OKI2018_I69.chr2.g6865.t1.cds [Oikopleura dioica]|uniref:T-complex protein 1 subunit beta n=1 Tax=Oikopleura dioica TaxID=34765 RepID=A0ABN7T514_OIKDI|nr:Oidioi.mRNA.OKI2018_I69.chr2.g6865.t1.cds [Oikopleura dioica]
MAMAMNPIQVLQNGAEEEKAETARLSSFVGAIAIGDLVKSTLGPRGMDKILYSPTGQYGNGEPSVQVTNDGATILRSCGVDNPAAKILCELSKVQDDEVGDGTTSVTVFASELLREAERLVELKIHPHTIIRGWKKAVAVAREALNESAVDNQADPEQFKEDLFNIARTTLSSKLLTQHKDFFAKICVDAILKIRDDPKSTLESIQIIKKLGASLESSFLDEGFLLDKTPGQNQPRRVENARVLLANTAMDTDKIKVFGSRVRTNDIKSLAEIEAAEKEKMKEKVEKICKYDMNVFINRQLIYNYPEQLFADNKVMAIEHADFEGIERLALVLGGEIVSTFDNAENVKIGKCDLIEEVMIGEDKLLRFSGVSQGQACSLVLRGATEQILDEAERAIHDVLCVLYSTIKETRTVYGGGCSEALMAQAVQVLVEESEGKEQHAIQSFANALRQLPTIMADNAGLDSADLIAKLRAEHAKGNKHAGLDLYNGCVASMDDLKVTESFKVKRQVLLSGHEGAEMIMRVDDILKSAPRQRAPDRCM